MLSQYKIFINASIKRYPALAYIAKWVTICALLGAAVGTASAFFLQTLDWATNYRETHNWILLLLPIGGGLIGLLYYYWGKDVEAGNNLLLDTIHSPNKPTISFKMAPFVYLGTIVTHLLGGSAGREGTALQMAGAIADQLVQPLRLSTADRQVLLVAAIAAGFGSVFGTPLAGAVFALEVFLVGKLRYNTLFPSLMAASLADVVTRLWHTQHTQYPVIHGEKLSFLLIFYSMLSGIIFGWCAAAFSIAMHYMAAWYKQKITFAPIRPLVGGIVVLLIIWISGTTQYIGLGIPVIVQSFYQHFPPYVFALKMLLTVLTLSAGFKGGEVTPLFFIGALLGNALSYVLPLPTELLVAMGFVAVFAGATNTPIACTIMAMELFGNDCGLYAAIACVVAYLASGHNSIYHRQVIGEVKHTHFKADLGKRFGDL